MERLRFKNVSDIDVSVTDIGNMGKETGKTVLPGDKINITREALIDQSEDMIFLKSYLIFVGKGKLPEELEDNPNHLTDKEVEELVHLTNDEAIEGLKKIDSEITLKRALKVADKKKIMDYLKSRLLDEFKIRKDEVELIIG